MLLSYVLQRFIIRIRLSILYVLQYPFKQLISNT